MQKAMSYMKRTFGGEDCRFSVILLSVATLAAANVADARCKFKTDESGLERGKRYTVSATMTTYVRFEFWRQSDRYFINAIVGTVLSGINANVDKDSPLLLTLEGGEILALTPLSESETKRTFLGFGINRKISGGVYILPEDAATRLQETNVVGIEFQYKDDGEISSKSWKTRRGDKKNIKKGTACLFS